MDKKLTDIKGKYEFVEGVVILGAGGLAREIYCHMKPHSSCRFLFVDDVTDTKEVFGCEVIKDWVFPESELVKNFQDEHLGKWKFVVGVGDPHLKEKLVTKALEAGLEPLETFIHPKALVQDASLGKGGVICPGVVITTNVTIGDYVTVNLNTTIGHDTYIGDYVNISPGCNISGNNHIDKHANIGTGTVTREEASIASDVVVGAQSTVIKDLEEPGVYVGSPARPL